MNGNLIPVRMGWTIGAEDMMSSVGGIRDIWVSGTTAWRSVPLDAGDRMGEEGRRLGLLFSPLKMARTS